MCGANQRSWRWPVAAWLALCGWGCGQGPTHVAPPEALAETWVLALLNPGGDGWRLSVHPGTSGWTASFPEDEAAYLLGYSSSSAELGLDPGQTPECALQRPAVSLRLSSAEDGWRWQEVSPLPDSLLLALAGGSDRCDVCAPIPMRSVLAPHTHRYTGVAWFDDGAALGAYVAGFARILEARIDDLPHCAELIVGPTALAALGGDRFLVGGQLGHLAVLRFSDEGRSCVVETSTRAEPGALPALHMPFAVVAANPASPEAFDFYALRASGELYHWSEAGLRRLGAHELHPLSSFAHPSALIRLDARRAISSAGNRHVAFWEDGAIVATDTLQLPQLGVSNTPRDRITMLHVDRRAGRLLAGTAAGEVWARPVAGSGWSTVFRAPVFEAVGSVIEHRERDLVVLSGGDIASWNWGGEVCDAVLRIPGASNGGAGRLVLRDEGRILLADSIGASAATAGVVWIEP